MGMSLRDKLAPIAFQVGILSLITAMAFSLIYRFDESTPCPTYLWSKVAVVVVGLGFIANLVTLRKRGFLMALALLAVMRFTAPSSKTNSQAKNESHAIATIETIRRAEDKLFASEGRRGTIPNLVANGLLPRCVAKAAWGYWFETRVGENGLTITASPETTNSGRWTFYQGPDSVTRYSPEQDFAPAGLANRPVDMGHGWK